MKCREKIERKQKRSCDADQRWIRELRIIFMHCNPERYQEKPARDRKAHCIGKPKVHGHGRLEDPVHKQYSSVRPYPRTERASALTSRIKTTLPSPSIVAPAT